MNLVDPALRICMHAESVPQQDFMGPIGWLPTPCWKHWFLLTVFIRMHPEKLRNVRLNLVFPNGMNTDRYSTMKRFLLSKILVKCSEYCTTMWASFDPLLG